MKKRMDKYKYLDEDYEKEEESNFLFTSDLKTKKQYIDIKDINYINKYEEFTKEENNKYKFKISKNKALKISLHNNELIKDYCKFIKNYECESIEILEKYVDLVSLNDKKYWFIQITKGILYGIENIFIFDSFEDDNKYWKKKIDDEDREYLRCLIDIETGEYIYYYDIGKLIKYL